MNDVLDWFDTAKVSILVTGLVAFFGLWFQARSGRDQRKHDKDMARDARSQSRAEGLYVDLLRYLYQVDRFMALTNPVVRTSDTPPPPELPEDDEVLMLQSRMAAFGSAEVRKLVNTWFETRRKFFEASAVIDREPHSDKGLEAWGTTTEQRMASHAQIEGIAKQIRDEVGNSDPPWQPKAATRGSN